ncbi:copine-3-like [Ruditapes philippinarum]|uniref:copine-3-like n=1 Tax=Ruditapes philippinarum TaxID=129788 RepID=UPI00295BD226|nr:copine-3-like [Ruditapes philippinarum]XP_060567239.1 copine-3-like [Ruditapes philippinarum]
MAAPGMASRPMSKLELRISCRKLANKDVTSKSDPCAVVFVHQGGQWVELGRTENVENSLDPDFTKAFPIDYLFEEVQKVNIAVYDIDNSTSKLSDDDFLGQLECTLGQIVAGRPFHKPLLSKSGKPAGESTIIIRSEEVKEGGEVAMFTFKARKLENKDFLGKSDPYLQISKGNSDGSWQVIHRTEVVKNNLNPSWRPFSLPVHTLCAGDKSKPIQFEVLDWDSDGSHDLIGGFTVSLQDLQSSIGKEFPVINEHKKAKKKKYENSGYVILDAITVKRVPSFLEYIYGGMQINFTVGIDFTGSNGDPSTPTSLHYMDPYRPNEYVQAIQAVGTVCQDYDTDKMFPALGFGAKLPTGDVSHEFAINFNPQNPFCAGIQGIIQAYQNCIPQVKLWGPTNAAPIIHHVARFAAAAQQEEATKGAHAYFVLLLLTDGALTDMDDTRTAIVHASALPMSLIIVGVGRADFSDMRMLDGDDGVLRAPNGQPVHRDIVQFVPFRDFQKGDYNAASAAELAKHVLAEVPQQVTHYYNWRGMQPNQQPPRTS